jgi:hypothetical protein
MIIIMLSVRDRSAEGVLSALVALAVSLVLPPCLSMAVRVREASEPQL